MRTDMTSSLSSALSGLQVGMKSAEKAANDVAKLTTGSDSVREVVAPLIALQQAEQSVATASKVIKTDNETLGRFMDEKV